VHCVENCLTQSGNILHTVHTSCHPTLQHHNSYNRTDNYRQWNAVGSPDDGHKDVRNMLRYYWLPINHYLLRLVGLTFTYLSKMHGQSNMMYAKSTILVHIKAFIQLAFVISDFHRDLHDIWALLRYYAAYSVNSIPTFRDNLWFRNVDTELPFYVALYPSKGHIWVIIRWYGKRHYGVKHGMRHFCWRH